jgi:hypothetical protein
MARDTYYLEIECPGKKPKGKVISGAKAERKYRQLAKFKQSCTITLYTFEMNRLRRVAQRRRRGPTPR